MKSSSFRALIPIALLLLVSAIPSFADGPLWTDNYAKALQRAQAEDKAVLLDFTGSDWCEWCMKMKKETLDQPAFKQYAEKNLVLVVVDFPNSKQLPFNVKTQNDKLSKQFKVEGFPDLVLLTKNGTLLGRWDGYLAGGPSAFIAEIRKHYKGSSGIGATPAAKSGDDFDSLFKKSPTGS